MEEQDATKRFYDLVWPHLAAVLRVALILTGNSADAEDLAQETMMKAFRGMGEFSGSVAADAKPWLLTILRRARIDRLRSSASSKGTVSLDAVGTDLPSAVSPQATDPEVIWNKPERILDGLSDQQVIDALQKLPEEIRLTLLLVDVEGLDQQEAATILHVPVGTIKSRAHRGRAMLRETLLPVAQELRLVER